MMSARNPSGRAEAIRAGALVARNGQRRSGNPHPIQSEDWINWMEGFDHQTAWLQTGRGIYETFADPERSGARNG